MCIAISIPDFESFVPAPHLKPVMTKDITVPLGTKGTKNNIEHLNSLFCFVDIIRSSLYFQRYV